MEHCYGNVLAPTIEQNRIINLFAVTNLLELPLRVTKEFTEMTAEPASQISFNSFNPAVVPWGQYDRRLI